VTDQFCDLEYLIADPYTAEESTVTVRTYADAVRFIDSTTDGTLADVEVIGDQLVVYLYNGHDFTEHRISIKGGMR